MPSILDKLQPAVVDTAAQIAQKNAAILRRFYHKVEAECWKDYWASIKQGRTKQLGKVFEPLIRINVVRVKKRRGKPPLLVWLR